MKKLFLATLFAVLPFLAVAQNYPSPTFKNVTINGTVSGTGFSNYLASPPAIGGTSSAAGAFTTLSASNNDALFYQNSSGQSIPNATTTTITGWTKVSDRVNANFNASTGVFTAPATGDYLVSGCLQYAAAAGTVGNVVQAMITVNGTVIAINTTGIQTTTSITAAVCVTGLAHATSGQTIVLQGSQNVGAARALTSTAIVNTLAITRIP